MTNFVEDQKFHLVLSSNSSYLYPGFESLQLNNWSMGKFATFLRSPLKWEAANRYLVSLQEISLDYAVQNLSVSDSVTYLDPEQGEFWNAFSLQRSGHFSTVYSVLEEIAISKPASLAGKLELRFNDYVQRVEIVCDKCQIMLSENLALILGFDRDTIHRDGVNQALRLADPFAPYRYVHLLSNSLVEMSYVSGELLPLVRSLSIPADALVGSSRVTRTFSIKHYVPARVSSVSCIDFSFVRSDRPSEPVPFLLNCGPCVLTFTIKRDLLQFPQ